MNKHLTVLNIFIAITDSLISALGVLAFAWGSWEFHKWWLLLFTIIPLVLFSGRSVIIDADLEEARKGGEKDGRE